LAALDSVFGIFPNAGRHHVFPYLLKISLALGLTVLAAALSYRFFETPFLKVKKRHAIIESQPI
jgi:peptidoglycan/LPS O-acetylase OafA/YrhL